MMALSAAIDIGGHLAQCSDATVGRGVTATAEAPTQYPWFDVFSTSGFMLF